MKKILKNILFPTIILTLLSSCGSQLFYKSFVKNATGVKYYDKLYNEEQEKSVIIVPVSHIGKPDYFDDIKHFVDSLRDEEYVVFFEGVGFSDEEKEHFFPLYDSVKHVHLPVYYHFGEPEKRAFTPAADTLHRKTRKIIGFYFSDYDNQENKSFPRLIRKLRENKSYTVQSNANTGIKDHDFNADLSLPVLIEKYEQKNGEIILTECDFKTDLNAKYKCKDRKKYDDYDFMHYFRNEYVINSILDSPHKRIVVIYGQGHIPIIALTLTGHYGYAFVH